MFSFLKLADSRLNFYSLLDLKLSAELVTLSACHTGVNKVFPGDELHGLMRGFLHAGAPSLVASLWATSDASTAQLMKEMYGQIRAGASKRAALRSAQRAVKNEYGHPYYWAPLHLDGKSELKTNALDRTPNRRGQCYEISQIILFDAADRGALVLRVFV